MRRLARQTRVHCSIRASSRWRTAFAMVTFLLLAGVLRGSFADEDAEHATATRPVDFNRDVRSILSEHCYACHGPDAGKRKADPPLRLDTRDGLFGERDGSFPVIPAKPDDSVAIMRVTSEDDDVRMPPPKSGKPAL